MSADSNLTDLYLKAAGVVLVGGFLTWLVVGAWSQFVAIGLALWVVKKIFDSLEGR